MNEPITHIKDTTGNPAPLGLLGFASTHADTRSVYSMMR